MRKRYFLLLLLCSVLFSACNEQEQFSYSNMNHAQLLRMCRGNGWTGVEVLDAWNKGKLLHRYVLVPRDGELPQHLPEGTLIRTPLRRVVVLSSVHGALFSELECLDRVVGVCDTQYVQHDSLRRRLADHRLADLGSSMQVDAEKMVAVRPDAVLVSPFENAGYGQLENMGVPLVECADYMETSALGRAEWMKFYGLLMGKEIEADSLFVAVEQDYTHLKKRMDSLQHRPSLLCDLKQGSAWYVPGGRSYIAGLFEDAGAHYLFANNKESGSVPLSFESVYAQGRDAEVWVVKYGRSQNHSYESLKDENPLYQHFSPWKERRIFGCNTFFVPFFEEIPFHPERLLKDIAKVLHPDLLPDDTLRYYTPLSER